ncbi:isoprenylcysteine carboxylmethyltransferase family protein [Vallitalea pronyensis]|uniref:Isoprenylcysteine carboxylmethyltransferase family protein n=1 Tax=Vallitalea pronyensis TaxID=1348613 RepID=A0A8J8SIW5_9FIRM|nr:isoprenylcysteine carboxylmethyltransferase family protein [Vallitalea pronyensis]QUI24943.1 isoprenylcysteine carboxylmethyltransferase family protein [Vallitalea pronyensis]
MHLLPEHTLGLLNIWLYPLLYGMITMLVMVNISHAQKKKILTFPKAKKTKRGPQLSSIGFMFGKGLILYSVLVPIRSFNVYFYMGTVIYVLGLVLSVYAMWYFSKSDLSQPVTGGIYRLSRHPMQVMSFIMWFGIAIVSQTFFMVILVVLYGVLSYPSLKAQENYCMKAYGASYNDYMKKTPRYLFF